MFGELTRVCTHVLQVGWEAGYFEGTLHPWGATGLTQGLP